MMRFSTFLEWANKESGYSVLLLWASSLVLAGWGTGGGATRPEKKLQVPNTQLHEAVPTGGKPRLLWLPTPL